MTSAATTDEPVRAIARWRDRAGNEHTVVGSHDATFAELESWIRQNHDVATVERLGAPDPAPRARASSAAPPDAARVDGNTMACGADAAAEVGIYPDPRDIFGDVFHVAPAIPVHRPMPDYIARRCCRSSSTTT